MPQDPDTCHLKFDGKAAIETNDDLYDKALKAATDLFGDMRVSKADCRRNLQSLIDEIEVMLYSLGEDEEEND